jgi:ribonuclease D
VRPLSRDLILYARLDTHYLIPLRDLLREELQAHDLWQLAQEDFRLAANPGGVKTKPETPLWTRYSTRRDLTPRDLTILDALMSWRDEVASELDRPPFKVLDDERLLEIAAAKPATPAELAVLGLTTRQVQRWEAPILRAVERGIKSPPVKRTRAPRPDDVYLKRLEKLKEWRKKAAAEMDVESDVILPRPFLLALAEKGPQQLQSVMGTSPWRLEHFGDQIQKVLGG